MVGVATGTYSSIYVAAPILLWLVGKHKEKAIRDLGWGLDLLF